MDSATRQHSLPDPIYDPLAPDVVADPFPMYARLRRQAPVQWDPRRASWLVTSYAHCRAVLRDSVTFAADPSPIGGEQTDTIADIRSLDGPEHTAARELLVSALRAQPLDEMSEVVRHTVDTTMGQLGTIVGLDFVSAVARPVALRTICHLIGVEPPPTGEHFETLSHTIVAGLDARLTPDLSSPGDPRHDDRSARRELACLVHRWAEGSPGAGMLGWLQSRPTDHIPPRLLAGALGVMLHGGYEAASRLMSNALLTLARLPWPVPLPRTDREMEILVDELVRLAGPVHAETRACLAPTTLAGQRLRPGNRVILLLAAANRDPAVFTRPDEIALSRSPGRHLAFGRGTHACVGSHIATMQLRAILSHLTKNGLAPRLAGRPVFDSTATLRGLRQLPLSVVPTALVDPPPSTASQPAEGLVGAGGH